MMSFVNIVHLREFPSISLFSFSQIFVFMFFVTIAFYVKLCVTRWRVFKLLPGKEFRFFSLLGSLIDLPTPKSGFNLNVFFLESLEAFYNLFRNEKLFCVYLIFFPAVVLVKPEAIEELIGGTRAMKKSYSYRFLHPWLGKGLLTSEASKWKSRRKLLTPSFHFDILKEFLPVFNENAKVLIKILKKEAQKDFVDIISPVTLCSLDIICETTLGVSIKAQENKNSEYVKAVNRVSEIIGERLYVAYHWVDMVFSFTASGKQLKADLKLIHDFTRNIIREKKERILSGDTSAFEKKRKALMDVLLEHHFNMKDLTEEDIREEVDTFAFEGHDTTSMGMSWALYLTGLHRDVQDKLHDEMDRIFGDDFEREVCTDDLKDMTYLDRVLKETQRLFPSVPMIAREAEEDIKICGYPIPKGTQCVISAYVLHRDNEVFPNPERFDPDRFLPEISAKRHPYSYIPFSAGPRNCIGQRFAVMEEKVILSHILRNFEIVSLDERDKLPPAADLVLRPPGPIRMKLKPRHRA